MRWPPYRQDVARRALDAFRGDFLIYLGEGRDGCCGQSAFFGKLRREWAPLEVHSCGLRIYDPRSWAYDLCWFLRRRLTRLHTRG